MRKAILLIVVFFVSIPITVIAQSQNVAKNNLPKTKLESFLSKKGRLYVKEFTELGVVKGSYGSSIELKTLVIYTPGQENNKIRGLQIQVNEAGRYEKSNISFLDIDEVESLSSAIGYMKNLLDKWQKEGKPYVEVEFATKGDYKIGFYQKGTNQGAYTTSGTIGKTTSFMSGENLYQIKELVDKGIGLLNVK